jgi:hypothetical protein
MNVLVYWWEHSTATRKPYYTLSHLKIAGTVRYNWLRRMIPIPGETVFTSIHVTIYELIAKPALVGTKLSVATTPILMRRQSPLNAIGLAPRLSVVRGSHL